MENKKIAFVGSGMIGAGLAVNALLNGYSCAIYDVVEPAKVQANVKKILDIMVEAEATTAAAAQEALGRASYTNDLKEAVKGAIFVQECAPEKLELKQSIYREIQETVGGDVIIASSTSAMMPSALQEGALYPASILVGHPYNPAYLVPLIEVCGGPNVPEETVKKAMAIYESMGKVAVHCKLEHKGFIVNQISWAVMDLAKQTVADGVCSVEDMDKAIMFGPGLRMAVTGQIMTLSLGIEGGLLGAAAKYGFEPDPRDVIADKGLNEAMARRTPEQGTTVESIIRFRDKMFAKILKLHGKL